MASTFNFFPATENEKKMSTIDYNAEQFVVRLLKTIFIDKDQQSLCFFSNHIFMFFPQQSSRPPTLLPTSNRTLNHPSFLPLYVAADFTHHHTNYNNQTGEPLIQVCLRAQ